MTKNPKTTDEVAKNQDIVKISAPPRSSENSFYSYLREIQKFPMLTHEEEKEYGTRFQKTGDQEAAKMLVQSHLRLVVSIAGKFKNYNLPITDLVSEGNVGLIQAVKKFDPDKGFRFATYAMWWIKAYIQEYILRSWSLVKIGTTAAQKKLFFNLGKIKRKLKAADSGNLLPEQIKIIAHDLNVSENEVVEMNSRMQNSDGSLNTIIGDEDDGVEIMDVLVSQKADQEELAISHQEGIRKRRLLNEALLALNDREKDIIAKRLLAENPATLEDLSQIYKISRERVRQIEAAALEKIKKKMKVENKFKQKT